jgi:hypothetical protein
MTEKPSDSFLPPVVGVDSSVPSVARVWNYWLGGKDYYPVDREIGDQILQAIPDMRNMARAIRAFLNRVVTYLAAEEGIRQFLDIGTGLPTANNTHEVAQRAAPESRIVYADNDPLVLAHARALLVGTRGGATDYVDADVRETDKILGEAARTLDFTKPVVLMLLGIICFVPDNAEAYAVVKRLVDALPSGSYLVLSHPTNAIHGAASDRAEQLWNETSENKILFRSPEEIGRFLQGRELMEPGIVSVSRWRPDPVALGVIHDVDEFCGVGYKP